MVEDEDNDREMDSDDMRDFADQDLPDPSSPPPSTDHAGPIAQFLHALPDWMNCISDNVMKALEGFNGRPKARCYPFDIQGHRFRNRNPKVRYTFHIYRIPI